MFKIPTEEQRIKIYTKIENAQLNTKTQTNHNDNKENIDSNIQFHDQCRVNDENRKLTKKQMNELITKLTKNTKKQYILKQQIKNIRKINLEKRKIAQNDEKIQQRLLKAGKQLEKKKQLLKEKELQKISATLQSVPKISQKSKNKIDKPLIQRMDELVQNKEELLRNLALKYDPIFKPKLNPYSLFMAEVQTSKNFLQRVQEHKQNKKQQQNVRISLRKHIQMENATFKPTINQKSKKIVETQRRSDSQKKISTSKKQKCKQQDINKFKPQINKKSQEMVRTKGNKTTPFYQRLYNDMRRISLKKLQKQKQTESKHNFQPHINQKSLKILKNKTKQFKQVERTQKYFSNDLNQYQQIPFYQDQLFRNELSNYNQSQHNFYENFEQFQQVKYNKYDKQNIKSLSNLQNQLNQKLKLDKKQIRKLR